MMKATMLRATAAVVTTALLVASASAGISSTILSITVSNSQGSQTQTVDISDAIVFPNGQVLWNAGLPAFGTPGNPLAQFVSPILVYQTDQPSVNPLLSFSYALNNLSSEPISVTITSGLLDFPTFAAEGAMSGTFGGTDENSTAGVELTGQGGAAGNALYTTYYNGASAGMGSTFGELFTSPLVFPGSFSMTEDFPLPPGNTSPFGAPLSNMSFVLDYTLSGGDRMSGQLTYRAVPEPTSLVLLGLGALALFRRR